MLFVCILCEFRDDRKRKGWIYILYDLTNLV